MNTELEVFDLLKAQVTSFIAPVQDITVTDAASNAVASGTLRTIKEMMKQIDGKRVLAVKPLNDRVKAINEYAKDISKPLEEAEARVKSVMASFADLEAARAAEAQKKIDDERRAGEARAREIELKAQAEVEAKRKAAEAEAEQRRKAEAKRLAQEQADEKKALLDRQKKEAEAAKMFGIDPAEQKAQALAQKKALEEKAKAEKKAAEERAEKERKEAIAKAEQEALANKAKNERENKALEDALKEQERSLEANRVKNTKQVAEWRVADESLLPEAYWMVDEVKLGAAIRAGARDIPGVQIRMKTVVVAR